MTTGAMEGITNDLLHSSHDRTNHLTGAMRNPSNLDIPKERGKLMQVTQTVLFPTDTVALRIRQGVQVSSLISLVDTAYDGGAIAYWVDASRNAKRGLPDESGHRNWYQFEVLVDDIWHLITVNTIIQGIERVLNGAIQVNDAIRRSIAQDLAEGLDYGYIDDTALDVIIQAGLFGDIVYG